MMLFRDRSAEDVALSFGLTDAVDQANGELDARSAAVYEVRRIFRRRGDRRGRFGRGWALGPDPWDKGTDVWRSLRALATGSRAAMVERLGVLHADRGGEVAVSAREARLWFERATAPYPSTEHYLHLAHTDPRLEDALNTVWVSGPGAAIPGLLLSSGEPMTRQQAEALAIDLTRMSTPAEGGFCTFQPVVDGNACPWNMDCHNCDKFVMSGADLVYCHRKREQWRTLAERAPDPGTADFLHQVFDPTARAIEGLEKALAAVGLLDEALALDLRRPQDYFGRVWATAFRAEGLTRHIDDEYDTNEDQAEQMP
jgi:hypothetical protein